VYCYIIRKEAMALDLKKGFGSVKLPNVPWSKLSRLSKLHKILIAVGIFCALWGCFIWFLYMPQKENISKIEKDLTTARDKLARLRKVEKNLREFKKTLKDTEAKFKEALRLLPDKEEIPTLLASISNLGAKSGLEFLLFKPQNEVRRNFYAEIPLKMEVLGPYHNVALFFDQVSRLGRIVNVQDLTMAEMKASKSGDATIVLKTGCTATTYKFIEPEKAPKKKGARKKKGKKK
jgi:type IV pilus assembly protein PilO